MASNSTWKMYRAFAGTGVFCALLIVVVFQATEPVIAHNKAQALNRAVLLVLADAQHKQAFRWTQAGAFEAVSEADGAADVIYAGYTASGQLAGIAIPAQGMGYQDKIELLYGYSPTHGAVVGMKILSSRETPGLGSKIGTDETFLQNFKRLVIQLNEAGGIAQAIEVIKPTQQRQAWQINAISGATVSSKAVANIINQSSEFWIPKIMQQLERFEGHER